MRVNRWISENVNQLKDVDWNPVDKWRDLALPFLGWFLGSFIFVAYVSFAEARRLRPIEYLSKAIEQAIGPMLWNVIGAFAFMLFSLTLIFPKCRWLAGLTHHLLMAVYLMGAMMIGIMFSQLLFSLGGLSEYLQDWRTYFFVPLAFILFLFVVIINCITGYLAYLVLWSDRFLAALSDVSLVLRVLFGAVPALIVIWRLLVEP